MMGNYRVLIFVALAGLVTAGCSEKKKTEDIIVPKAEVKAPKGPVRMQDYPEQKASVHEIQKTDVCFPDRGYVPVVWHRSICGGNLSV